MRQLFQLVRVQFLEFFREPGVIFWALLFPVVMAWGLGLAFGGKSKVEHTVAWVQSPVTNKAIAKLTKDSITRKECDLQLGNPKTGIATYHFVPATLPEAALMVKRGITPIILSAKGDSLKFLFDPKNSEAQLAYLQLTATLANANVKDDGSTIEIFDQKGMRYIDFLVPGLLAMNIMFGSMWGISYSLVEKRSKKLMRRMVATPMNKTSFLFSFFFTRIALSIVELLVLLFFAWVYFGMTVQGNVFALVALMLAGNIAFFGLAVLVSSKTAKTQVANGMINAITMPMMITSGIFFSYHNFPAWMGNIIAQFPLTRLADSMRSVFIEGAGFAETGLSIAILVIMGIICFFAGKRIYKWY